MERERAEVHRLNAASSSRRVQVPPHPPRASRATTAAEAAPTHRSVTAGGKARDDAKARRRSSGCGVKVCVVCSHGLRSRVLGCSHERTRGQHRHHIGLRSASTQTRGIVVDSVAVRVVSARNTSRDPALTLTRASCTRDRKKSAPPSSTRSAGNQERERFLSALETELGTPALCSCARNMASSPFYERPCANNCALYNDPKKREKLFTSVYKQQQQ